LLFASFLAAAFFISLGIFLLRLPRRRIASQLMRRFNRVLRIFLNVKIDFEGARDCLGTGGRLIISNHLGYLDGIVLGSLFPVIFVTKRQVKRWPVIGQLLTLLGTIFVDRENKQNVLGVIDRISGTLRQGANVLIFPEGTSTNGEKLLPFQSAFFAAPLMARASIAPVTISYRFVDREPLSPVNRDRVYWYGDMSFVPHLWDLLGTKRIDVSVKIDPPIETALLRNSSQCRKELSQACYDTIVRRLTAQTEKNPKGRGHSLELSAVNRSEKKLPAQALT
jgi:1-acyl-sn-glycerol-3-phosphate acyltransferase